MKLPLNFTPNFKNFCYENYLFKDNFFILIFLSNVESEVITFETYSLKRLFYLLK